MNFRDIGWGCMDWIDLAHYRNQWRALVNVVMNLRVSIKFLGISWMTERLATSQEAFRSVKLVRYWMFASNWLSVTWSWNFLSWIPGVHLHVYKHPNLTPVNLVHNLISYFLGP
jgi:hypothetical protein